MSAKSAPSENVSGVMPASDREAHEQMGFHAGWAKATDQLEAVVAKL